MLKSTKRLFLRLWSWDRIKSWFTPTPASESRSTFTKREKVMVVGVAYLLAIGLWFMVNMDREFTTTFTLPVVLGELPDARSLQQPIPESVDVTVNGSGWKLMNLAGNLPTIVLDVRKAEVDVLTAARDLIATTDGLSVIRVQPFVLTVRLDERITKRVPVESRLSIEFRNRYNQVGPVRLFPDSIDIAGARAIVDTIRSWPTEASEIDGVREALDLTLTLQEAPYILQLSHNQVRLEADVAEYTEGEARIPIRVRGQPRNRDVVFSPASVVVKYDVPIDEYSRSLSQVLFAAYVPYAMAASDSTGFVIPQIERTESALHIRIRSHQPRTVSYYHVVNE
jgi:YbbR domain-containing protein